MSFSACEVFEVVYIELRTLFGVLLVRSDAEQSPLAVEMIGSTRNRQDLPLVKVSVGCDPGEALRLNF
jgi:hypothetical protein